MMSVKLFVLGLPGSGKSTISRYIVSYVQDKHNDRSIQRFNDYDILLEMFQADKDHKHFKPKQYNGFKVKDLLVYDKALEKIEQDASTIIKANNTDLVLIEFARDDYTYAFDLFDFDFLQDAFILFLDAHKDICKKRVSDRVLNPQTADDHFVPKHIFKAYHNKNKANKHLFLSSLNSDYNIDNKRIKVIKNNSKEQDIYEELNQFIDSIFDQTPGNVMQPAYNLFEIS
jgi:adenylate kinase family enzyme